MVLQMEYNKRSGDFFLLNEHGDMTTEEYNRMMKMRTIKTLEDRRQLQQKPEQQQPMQKHQAWQQHQQSKQDEISNSAKSAALNYYSGRIKNVPTGGSRNSDEVATTNKSSTASMNTYSARINVNAGGVRSNEATSVSKSIMNESVGSSSQNQAFPKINASNGAKVDGDVKKCDTQNNSEVSSNSNSRALFVSSQATFNDKMSTIKPMGSSSSNNVVKGISSVDAEDNAKADTVKFEASTDGISNDDDSNASFHIKEVIFNDEHFLRNPTDAGSATRDAWSPPAINGVDFDTSIDANTMSFFEQRFDEDLTDTGECESYFADLYESKTMAAVTTTKKKKANSKGYGFSTIGANGFSIGACISAVMAAATNAKFY